MLRYLTLLFYLLLAQSCAEQDYKILEEKAGSQHRFTHLKFKLDQRQGPELGLLISGQIEPALTGEPYAVRISAVNALGKVLPRNSRLEAFSLEEAPSQPDSSLGLHKFPPSRELRVFAEPCQAYTQYFKAFLPYHLFLHPEKRNRLLLQLEGLPVEIPEVFPEERGRLLSKHQKQAVDASLIVEVPFEIPPMSAATLEVLYVETDRSQLRPHEWDFSLARNHPDWGYPDLYWSLQLDDQQIYRSAFVKNSLKTDFDRPSPVFYARRHGQYASICVWDSDPHSHGQGRDDLISCFDLELQELDEQKRPVVGLQLPRISEMDVRLNWLSD